MSKQLFFEERERDIASPLELNSLMQADKAKIKDRVMIAVDQVNDGNVDPLEALIFAKKGQELFTLLEKNVRPLAEGKGVQKGYVAFDVEVIERSAGNKYDFTVCEDSVYNELIEKLEKLQLEIKGRETFLKSLKEPVANVTTGEIINPPSVTFGKVGLALTLK